MMKEMHGIATGQGEEEAEEGKSKTGSGRESRSRIETSTNNRGKRDIRSAYSRQDSESRPTATNNRRPPSMGYRV